MWMYIDSISIYYKQYNCYIMLSDVYVLPAISDQTSLLEPCLGRQGVGYLQLFTAYIY